jgi:hypothetical protein
LQRQPQVPLVHVGIELGGLGQIVHEVGPQDSTLLLGLHDAAAPSPHLWKFCRQVKPQTPFSQVALALAGTVHGVHEVPHEFTSVSGAQVPLHRWRPAGHMPAQGMPGGRQALLVGHSDVPVGQVPPHVVPSQLAVPPVGAMHAVHDVPQFAGSMFDTQASPQRW